jgi:hypothetical protein
MNAMTCRALVARFAPFFFWVVAAAAVTAGPARAQERCSTLRFAFQPDCFEPPCTRRKLADRLDLGPQIAVWVESADRARFVDTLMVTSLTAKRGIGNRPGVWNMPSGPKQPYGKRTMVLPVWGWSRGVLYDQVIMQDGQEGWMGFHEPISSPDPYFCRPMSFSEIDVDAVSCPTKVFNSAKGRFAPELPKLPYPPRGDLNPANISSNDCDTPSSSMPCASSAQRFASVNDLDAVAAATPPFGRTHEGYWTIPAALAEGDYALMLEVNREFDQTAQHTYPAHDDTMLSQSGFTQTGLPNNIGQPSVVFRVPFRVGDQPGFGSTDSLAGYADFDGATGTLHPPDSTISNGPGSGAGRLLSIPTPWPDQPATMGKLFVRVDCGQSENGQSRQCEPPPPPPAPVTDMVVLRTDATSAKIEFRHSGDGGRPVLGYDVRIRQGEQGSTEENFLQAIPVAHVDPADPGSMASFTIGELKPLTTYVVGVRAKGRCGAQSALTQQMFTTADLEFTQLTGCFIATAAYGSALAESVHILRRLRDRVRSDSALTGAVVDLYERSSPPLATVLGNTEVGRAIVRQVLAPAVELLRVAGGPPPAPRAR